MLNTMCPQLPCANIERERFERPGLADRRAARGDLARAEAELEDGALEIGHLVENPDRRVRHDQRDRHDRERPGRELVSERKHPAAYGTISASSAFCACRRFSAWSQAAERGPCRTLSVTSSP